MLEKPNIPDKLIVSRVQEAYGLRVATLTFLPIGADVNSAVYRVVASDSAVYFLKLRRNFNELLVTVPLFLKSEGIDEILAPFETKPIQGWADCGEYTLILYPFVDGHNGFQMELSDSHKRTLGAALKKIHSVNIPLELKRVIPQETFSPHWREFVSELQQQVEDKTFNDRNATKLADFIKSKRNEIDRLLGRTQKFASQLQSRPLEFVLCHTDLHGGNMLICRGEQPSAPMDDKLYIVDWDAPLLAPKERDLMFVGGGVDQIWKTRRDESVFYEGYGKTKIDFAVMAYYRYERVIEDLAAYGEQLLLTDEGGADREEAYERFIGNFEPGQTIEIADKTYELI